MSTNPELFGSIVLPQLTRDKSQCILHKDIYQALMDRPRQMAIIAPRGHSKTSIASTIGTVFDIAYDREDVIILIKKTFPQAVTDLKAITDNVKFNDLFKLFFGNREFLIDRQERVFIRNPYTGHKTYIEVKGSNQPVRGARSPEGKRPTKVLMDDFEDEKNVLTEDQREKLKQYVAGQIIPAMEPSRSSIIAIGTIVHYDSWLNNLWERYQEAKKQERLFSWEVIFHQMIEDGEPIWPERFTPEFIEQLRQTYEDDGRINDYYQEYFNIPFNVEDADFKRSYIRYWTGYVEHNEQEHLIHIMDGDSEVIKPCDFIVAIDPSSGTSGDYTGIAGIAVTSDGKRYVEIAERKMIKPDALKEHIFEIWLKYKPRLIILEEVAMQVILGYWLREEMLKRNIFIPIKGEKVSTKTTKEDKLRQGLQPIYSTGAVYHKKHHVALEEELFTFPKQRHDDVMDAEYMAMKYTYKPESDTIIKKVNKRVHNAYDWLTGIRKDAYGKYREHRQVVSVY